MNIFGRVVKQVQQLFFARRFIEESVLKTLISKIIRLKRFPQSVVQNMNLQVARHVHGRPLLNPYPILNYENSKLLKTAN